jgi:hypothetical protein
MRRFSFSERCKRTATCLAGLQCAVFVYFVAFGHFSHALAIEAYISADHKAVLSTPPSRSELVIVGDLSENVCSESTEPQQRCLIKCEGWTGSNNGDRSSAWRQIVDGAWPHWPNIEKTGRWWKRGYPCRYSMNHLMGGRLSVISDEDFRGRDFRWTRSEHFIIDVDDLHIFNENICACLFNSNVSLTWLVSKRVLNLEGCQQQQTNASDETGPNTKNLMIAEPSANSDREKYSTPNYWEPEVSKLHVLSLHPTFRLVIAAALAGLGLGVALGFCLGMKARQ